MKKILFLTGTRADYGKLKSLIKSIEDSEDFECHIFVTGMHTLFDFGDTKTEITKDNYSNVHVYMNQIIEEPMDLILANTLNGFSRYIRELHPDLIVVHGDRVEALAASISGAINNILVAHIEGGEVSGTIDESFRHAITKMSHLHFVSNDESKRRLLQLGENPESIFVIGSPDIDVILAKSHLSLKKIYERYEINFLRYAILIYHPVTTEFETLHTDVRELVDAVIESGLNYIVISPNNDSGFKIITNEYKKFNENSSFKVFPSIRFEYFIELLKNSEFIIGNSSVGVHEAPVIGIPTINIGSRQNQRFLYNSVINSPGNKNEILNSIKIAMSLNAIPTHHFGDGNSANQFLKILKSDSVWNTKRQKAFLDLKNE